MTSGPFQDHRKWTSASGMLVSWLPWKHKASTAQGLRGLLLHSTAGLEGLQNHQVQFPPSNEESETQRI